MINTLINTITEALTRFIKTPQALPKEQQKRSHAMKKKAIAYTSDIILGQTGEIINRAYQKALISQFAEENDIEVVAWFEDEVYDEEILTRPGIKNMLAYENPYDMVLVERVWALSRKIGILAGFLKVLAQKKVTLGTATYLWDCTSQMVRHQFTGKAPAAAKAVEPVTAAEAPHAAAVRKPETVHFGWAFDPHPAK
jgi:hypothetical protein